jgi:hypothetical protein
MMIEQQKGIINIGKDHQHLNRFPTSHEIWFADGSQLTSFPHALTSVVSVENCCEFLAVLEKSSENE